MIDDASIGGGAIASHAIAGGDQDFVFFVPVLDISYIEARAQIVQIVESINPTSNVGIVGPTVFVHAHPGDDGDELRSRSFWLEANVGAPGRLAMPYTPDLAGNPRMIASMEMVVAYGPTRGRLEDFDVNLERDAVDIAVALLNPINWGSRGVTAVDYVEGLSWRRVKFDDGGVEQRFTFDLHFVS